MELEITWERVVRVWWAYLWRSLIVMILTFVALFVSGVILGLISKSLGFEHNVILTALKVFGFIVGICSSVIPFKWILGKDMGSFKLVLMSNSLTEKEPINA